MLIKNSFHNDIITSISETASENKYETYLVGGFLRDLMLGKDSNDIDITIIGDGISFGNKVAEKFGKQLDTVYKKFGTALLNLTNKNGEEFKIEFASARKESYYADSRKPEVTFSTLEDDLKRRDFTINALAYPLHALPLKKSGLIDMFGGIPDIQNKIIKTPLEPGKTFEDDPLRIMRAARFASQLQFKIDSNTLDSMKKMANRLEIISQERISDEFLKILESPKPSIGLNILKQTCILEKILPEAADMEGIEQRKDFHHKDVFFHTLEVIDNISLKTNYVWLRYAALMHDIAKPATKKFIEGIGWTFHGHEDLGAKWQKNIFKRMKLPLSKLPYVEKLIRLHLRPIALANESVTDSAVRRLISEAGDDIDDLMTLCRADITSKDAQKIKEYTSNFDKVEKRISEVEERDKIRNFKPPVTGEDIMKIFNLEPGRKIGEIKSMIEEAILEGNIPNEREAAMKYLEEIKDKL